MGVCGIPLSPLESAVEVGSLGSERSIGTPTRRVSQRPTLDMTSTASKVRKVLYRLGVMIYCIVKVDPLSCNVKNIQPPRSEKVIRASACW